MDADENPTYIVGARCTAIDESGVTYIDADGKEVKLAGGTVVLAAGMRGKSDDAMKFYKCAPDFNMIGDCAGPGSVSNATRSAYGAAIVL